MKLEKQRNIYLKRMPVSKPRKYFYDTDSGKHFLIEEDGSKTPISKIGTFHPKFRQNKSGFLNNKQRYQQSQKDFSALHFSPETTFKSSNQLYTPTTRKFIGYAQLPYKMKDKKFPRYLCKPNSIENLQKKQDIKKSPSLCQKNSFIEVKDKSINSSLILERSASHFRQKKISDYYYQNSFNSITDSKPLPKQIKKSCYNYQCKNLKKFTFDNKNKIQTKFFNTNSTQQTFGKSFFEKKFELENKQMTCN